MRLSELIDLPARVVRNAATSYVGFGVQAAIALLLTPFLVHRLGPATYGAWVLLTTLLGYFQLLELGLVPAVTRYVAHHHAKGERAELQAVIGSALVALSLLSALALPLALLAGWYAPSWFALSPEQGLGFARAAWLAGAAAVAAFFRRLFTAVIEGYQQFPVLNLCATSGALVAALGSVAVVLLGHGLPALIAVTLLQLLFETLFLWLAMRRLFGFAADPRRASRESLKKLAAFSSLAFLVDLAVSVSHRIDTVLVGVFLSEGHVTSYSLGGRLAGLLQSVTDPLIDTFFPHASESEADASGGALRRLLTEGTRISLLLLVAPLLVVAWHGQDLIRWWLGGEYVGASLPILHVFLAVVLLSVYEATAARILLGTGQLRFDATVSSASALLTVLLCLWWIPAWGILGAAWARLVASFLSKVAISVPWVCHLTGTPFSLFLRRGVGPPALAAALIALVLAASTPLLPDPVISLVVHALLATLATLAVMLWWRPKAVVPAPPGD